ncbi:Uncharacterised protein [uncultured archaeon]|nr:Uncharacterised protein [uncultured archaeon]
MEEIKFLAGSEKRFFDFISKLSDKDKIALLSHNDADGLTSAVIVAKVIGNVEYVNFMGYKMGMLAAIIPELKKNKINKVIMTDLSIDGGSEGIKELEKFAEVLIIDHHVFSQDLNSEKTTFIKAASGFPAAYMCYYLFSKIQKIDGWIAARGIVSDRVDRYHNRNVCEVFNDFGLGETPRCEYFWKSVMNLGYALIYFRDNEKKIFDILMKAKNFDDVKELDKYAGEVEAELDKYMKDFEKNREEFYDMMYYYYKPKFSINSMFASAVSGWDKGKTYVIACGGGDFLRVSARRQDKQVDCVKLLQESVVDIPQSTAGGHVPAAGANFPEKYLAKFKENLFRVYGNMRKL